MKEILVSIQLILLAVQIWCLATNKNNRNQKKAFLGVFLAVPNLLIMSVVNSLP